MQHIAVIGAGVAGLTAIQHALSAGRSVVHVMGVEPMGGLVCNVGELRGYPPGSEPVSGLDLAIDIFSGNATRGAIEVLYGRELSKKDAEARGQFISMMEDEYRKKFATPYVAAKHGYIDDVIEPRNTRFRIIRALQSLSTKRDTLPMKKHSNIPL